jgi:hypothetical protein
MNLAILILKTEASEMQEVEASECLEDDASEMQEVEASESHTPYVTDEYPEPLDLHQPSHFPIASTNLVAQVLKEHMQFDAIQLWSFAPYDPGPLESPFVTIIESLPRYASIHNYHRFYSAQLSLSLVIGFPIISIHGFYSAHYLFDEMTLSGICYFSLTFQTMGFGIK